MRCAISSRAGQVLARGNLAIQKDEDGELRLVLRTDAGTLIQGGTIPADGDLTSASQVLFRQLFETWGMSDVTITAKSKM
ncbi:hypothetical protein [Aerosakkonema funiforme]|uniref:Uncharacterized protein n=1 Tax=Aerosakkonema funiforme FACHB-1375 TaxID=2949571 RepID=A0A926VCA8_9CYAN|nr:hypothetical protein [Aerosakkonema funiforme]MBD2181151.1 hypothetical protein [Aerosakkonema funiforme FACHB-1375]